MDTPKIDNKLVPNLDYINNILPECLDSESQSKFLIYENYKLKSDYLIDLTSYLISKFLSTDDVRVALSSEVLRKRYGEDYPRYVKYLVDKNIIKLIRKHLSGKSSRIYEFNKRILKSELKTFRNFDKFLIKKYKKNLLDIDFTSYSQNNILPYIKEKLINDLFYGTIDEETSNYLLNSFISDNNVYVNNKYSVDCINKKQIFFHFDSYGRLHTNFTNLKSIIRKNCLYIDGEKTIEIDIKNSQPRFLNKLIEIHTGEFDFNKHEIKLYRNLTNSGGFYNYLIENTNINEIKKIKDSVYKVLFGKNYPNYFEKRFEFLFPTIYAFIKFYKNKMGGYKYLSHKLQSLESDLIFNNIIRDIFEINRDVKLITVHDSIICKVSDYNFVNEIFQKNIEREFSDYSWNLDSCIESEINI